ncbi:hypothetical protein TGMAS_235740 [Toxoplasma gondii MAS]|uniref:FHA domain-containing protein n=1 Tax=Toxoplasma gondii MAS TaxID=943118 RepID=A0A086PUL0_TOXGO|nr:hypothetical protein TGMAS_235740 [Toxoplasma gondii MAS]
MAFLVEFEDGKHPTQCWRLASRKTYVIGRNSGAVGIRLPHASISRKHAELSVFSEKDATQRRQTQNADRTPAREDSRRGRRGRSVSSSRSRSRSGSASRDKASFQLLELSAVNGTFINEKRMREAYRGAVDSDVAIAFADCPHRYKVLSEPPSSSLPCIAPRSRSESPRGSSKLGTKSESHASSSHSSSTRETRAYSRSRSREGDERRGRRRSRWSSRQEKKKKAPSRSPSRSSSRSSRSSRRSRKKRSGWTDASSEEKKREELDAQMNEIIANAQSAKAKQDAEKRMQSALDASLQAGALTNPMNSAGLNLTIGRGLSLLNCGTPAAVAQRAAQAAADRLLSPSPLAQAAVLNLLASNPGLAGLVGASQAPTSSGLSVQEKRKLLWGKKSEKESEKEKAGEDSENGKDEKVVDPNRYSLSFRGDEEKKHKFLKLMGFKGEAQQPQPSTAAVTTAGKEALDSAAQQKMNSELEFQYFQGIKRKDGRKTGLGL